MGGGDAAWTTAATLARKLGGQCSIHVVDSGEAPTAGFAQATQPAVLELLRFLGIDQNDFIDKTQSTYSLGRRVSDWSAPGESFWHPFGAFGALVERRPFFHFWHKARALGLKPRLELFSLEASHGGRQPLHLPDQYARHRAAHALCAAHGRRPGDALPARHRRARRRHPPGAEVSPGGAP